MHEMRNGKGCFYFPIADLKLTMSHFFAYLAREWRMEFSRDTMSSISESDKFSVKA